MQKASLFVLLIHLVYSTQPQCIFVPDNRLDCVEYLQYPSHETRCLKTVDALEVAGPTKKIAGIVWIKILDKQTQDDTSTYVRAQHGTCIDNCCTQLPRKRRTFGLLTSALSKLCDPAEAILGKCCKNGGHMQFPLILTCKCPPNYSGPFCEATIEFKNISTAIPKPAVIAMSTATIQKTTITPSTTILPTTITPSTTILPTSELQTTDVACIDSLFVKCDDPNICSTDFKQFCRISCELCIPTTTAKPCLNDPMVQCTHPDICSSGFMSACPETCGLCGNSLPFGTQTGQKRSTTDVWLHIAGK